MRASPEDCRARLLGRLRDLGHLDPFADLVTGTEDRPEQISGYSDTIHHNELATLRAVCDSYRLAIAPQALAGTPPRSGVVVIQGARGSGKTTLLHRLRREVPDCLILRPTHFRPDRSFPQYLLQELVFELGQRDQRNDQHITLQRIARRLAGEILYHRLNSYSDVEWLQEHTRWADRRGLRRRWHDLLPHWGLGTGQVQDLRRALIRCLTPRAGGHFDVGSLFPGHEQSAAGLLRVALDHVQQTEGTTDLHGEIRAGLYARLVRLAFAAVGPGPGDPDQRDRQVRRANLDIANYLLEGYTREYPGILPAPELAVDALLRALGGLLVFQGIPIVVAFDALDTPRMLGDPLDPERARRFYGGLGDFLDNYAGLGFLIFAEEGYWSQAVGMASGYAMQRIDQGVLTAACGKVTTFTLREIDETAFLGVLRRRLTAAREQLLALEPDCREQVGDIFPFPDDFLRTLFPHGLPPLRQGLLKLRAEYHLLLAKPPSPAPQPGPEPPRPPVQEDTQQLDAQYDERWRHLLAANDQAVGANMSGLADALHAALNDWLGLPGLAVGGWRVAGATLQSLGPTVYEQFTVCRWERGDALHTSAVGFLLGFGTGLANDVRRKANVLAQIQNEVDSVLLVYPTARHAEFSPPYLECLPPTTRVAWDGAPLPACTRLRPVPRCAVLAWLAVPQWLEHFGGLTNDPPTRGQRANFLLNHTTGLFPHVDPQSTA